MNTDDLIEKLANEPRNTEDFSPKKSFLIWLLICAFCLLAGISSLGLREDWMLLIDSPLLLLQNLMILLGFVSLGYISLMLSVPGNINTKKAKLFISIPIVVWLLCLLLIFANSNYDPTTALKIGFGCVSDIIIIGVLPGAALFFFLAKGMVLSKWITGLVASVSVLMLGAWAVQYTCHNDSAVHILLWHFLPMLIGSLIGAGIFARIKSDS
jgi:hypothetical protein